MSARADSRPLNGAAMPWILEHLLTYPGTYEIPLRTMYTLNATTQNQPHRHSPQSPIKLAGNAFPRHTPTCSEDLQNSNTATAAAQLRANLMSHISQQPTQPASLPPSFVTGFVRRCFPSELEQVDFPQALTALDYLKDLEVRRRREVVAALDRLGIERSDIGHRDQLARKYPGVLRWVVGIEEKERKVEALYTQVYIGLRKWTLINELSLTPFNKANCIAMLNTLYPPIGIQPHQFAQPTVQLTPQILSTQRNGFFRYITAVERNGASVLSSLMGQHRREGETTGWPCLRETLDAYLKTANGVIDECYEITGRGHSPATASFDGSEYDEDGRRKVDSGISFGSGSSSNRNSGQSHGTRPSTSSSFSTHSRKASKEKHLADKAIPVAVLDDDHTITPKPAGSTLERIARELRKIKSRSNMREENRPRTAAPPSPDVAMPDRSDPPPQTPSRTRTLRLKRSLKNMRSNGNLRESSTSRPGSRSDEHVARDVPAFDAEEMRRKKEQWEAQNRHRNGLRSEFVMMERA